MLFVALMPVLLVLPLGSCGIARQAAAAAAEKLREESPNIIRAAAEAAGRYWSENKDAILAGSKNALDALKEFAVSYWDQNKASLQALALEAATKAKDAAFQKALEMKAEAIVKANEYTDAKLAEARTKTVDLLVRAGHSVADMDADKNGQVSDDELAAYMKKNPTAFLAAGGAGLAFYLLWLSKQLKDKLLNKTVQS